MNSVLATHVCSQSEDFRPFDDGTVQLSGAVSGHTFCAICAISHSPLLAAPLLSLTSLQDLSEQSLSGPVAERSSLTVFTLYIRPPPASL